MNDFRSFSSDFIYDIVLESHFQKFNPIDFQQYELNHSPIPNW